MFFSKLKISTKLFISSAVFLIPIGVLFFFLCFNTVGTIQKSIDAHDGILSLEPAVKAMRNLPDYLNIYLGLEQGDLKSLDVQITSDLNSLNKEMERYRTAGKDLPDFLANWEKLKKVARSDENLFQNYLDFANSLRDVIGRIGEGSRLILVSDLNIYLLVSSVLSSMPEATLRLVTTGNLIRQNLYGAESLVEKWNSDLADAQAQGRRLTVKPYNGKPADITMSMLATADLQQIRNNYLFMVSDKDRITASLNSAMVNNMKRDSDFTELNRRLKAYQDTIDVLSGEYARSIGFNITNPCTAVDFSDTLSQLNADLCQLWSVAFNNLDMQIQRNTTAAKWQLVMYLLVVLVSLGIALVFVVFIALDVNRSVKSLKKLFRGLNENDLTLSLQINSRDEFGELMTAFNGFLNILRSTFGSFKHSSQLVADSVFDLSSS